jgi:hypothetical protein
MISMRGARRRGRVWSWAAPCATAAWIAASASAAATEYLVADQVGDRIVAFDAVTGEYTRTLWSTDDRVQPAAMTYGPGGDLFFANLLSGEVLRIDKDDLGGTNVAATPFVTGIDEPGAIAYHAASNSVLVGEFGEWGATLGNEVFVYDAAGQRQATLAIGDVAIAGLAFDAADNLYVSGFFTAPGGWGRIYKYGGPPSWQALGPFAPDPYPWVELRGAANIAFDHDGDMLVAGLITQNSGVIVKFDLENGQLVGQERLGDFIPFPSGLLMLEGNQLLVTSLGFGPTSGSVYRFNSETGARSVLLGGDFDQSGLVDANDLGLWTLGFELDASADADFDGDTDGADFLGWQRGLGRESAPGLFSPASFVVYDAPAAATIPEPSAVAISAVALIAACLRSRRSARPRSAPPEWSA